MKSNELRIGNIVGIEKTALHADGCKYEDVVLRVEQLQKMVCGFVGFHAMEYYKDLRPIPLTEEWLLRMGFEKQILDSRRCYYLEYDDRETLDIYEANGFFYFLHSGLTTTFIKSLHQLQNLYHIVTGKELTIKEQ